MRAMLTPMVALAITVILVQVARRVAPAVGLIDSPNARKSHSGDVPLVGGIAIFGALFAHWYGGEALYRHHLVGGGLIFMGMILAEIRPGFWGRVNGLEG